MTSREGEVINWRSSSGSASIVGVKGQMSVALMALPDASLNLRPWLWLKDEVVTQSRERQKETEEKEMRTNRCSGFGAPLSRLTFQLNCYHKCHKYC